MDSGELHNVEAAHIICNGNEVATSKYVGQKILYVMYLSITFKVYGTLT